MTEPFKRNPESLWSSCGVLVRRVTIDSPVGALSGVGVWSGLGSVKGL